LIAAGNRIVVDIDIEKFFDRVNHDILMGLVAKRSADRRILKLIRGFLTAGVLEGGLVGPTDEGTPQGGPLSPLLSNLMLDVLDKELEKRGHRFVRYADDCNIYVRSLRAGERVRASLERFLERRLKLKINAAKSAVARPYERKFLGMSFTSGKEPKRRIAPQALIRFKSRVRELTRRTRGATLAKIIEELSRYLIGWRGYFGLCQTPSVLRELDRWVRRRLRCIAWKQWKRGTNRFAELRRRGVGKDLAAQAAGSPHGPWRLSNSPALAIALPNTFFASLGLASVAAQNTA
jgi:RNA-directed DNA polymerase